MSPLPPPPPPPSPASVAPSRTRRVSWAEVVSLPCASPPPQIGPSSATPLRSILRRVPTSAAESPNPCVPTPQPSSSTVDGGWTLVSNKKNLHLKPTPLSNSHHSQRSASSHPFFHPTKSFCFRCGDSGHIAQTCRNGVLCYNCRRIGHYASTCRSPASSHSRHPKSLHHPNHRLDSIPCSSRDHIRPAHTTLNRRDQRTPSYYHSFSPPAPTRHQNPHLTPHRPRPPSPDPLETLPSSVPPLPQLTHGVHIPFSVEHHHAHRKMLTSAIVSVVEGFPSTQELADGLSLLWSWEWPWKPLRLSATEFLVEFPSRDQMIDICRAGPRYPPRAANRRSHSFGVKFKPWTLEWGSFCASRNVECWIHVSGLPLLQWSLKSISSFVNGFGDVIRLSATSLIKPSSTVTLKIACSSRDSIPSQFAAHFANLSILIKVRVFEAEVDSRIPTTSDASHSCRQSHCRQSTPNQDHQPRPHLTRDHHLSKGKGKFYHHGESSRSIADVADVQPSLSPEIAAPTAFIPSPVSKPPNPAPILDLDPHWYKHSTNPPINPCSPINVEITDDCCGPSPHVPHSFFPPASSPHPHVLRTPVPNVPILSSNVTESPDNLYLNPLQLVPDNHFLNSKFLLASTSSPTPYSHANTPSAPNASPIGPIPQNDPFLINTTIDPPTKKYLHLGPFSMAQIHAPIPPHPTLNFLLHLFSQLSPQSQARLSFSLTLNTYDIFHSLVISAPLSSLCPLVSHYNFPTHTSPPSLLPAPLAHIVEGEFQADDAPTSSSHSTPSNQRSTADEPIHICKLPSQHSLVCQSPLPPHPRDHSQHNLPTNGDRFFSPIVTSSPSLHHSLRRSARVACSNTPQSTHDRIAKRASIRSLETLPSPGPDRNPLCENTPLGSIHIASSSEELPPFTDEEIAHIANNCGFLISAETGVPIARIREMDAERCRSMSNGQHVAQNGASMQ